MKHTILLALMLVGSLAFAQTTATTEDGRKVQLNSDGTWSYTEEKEEIAPGDYSCAAITKTEEDEVTGKKTTGLKESLVVSDDGGKTGFGIYHFRSGKTVIWSMSVVGAGGCIDKGEKANILFRDGSRLEIKHSSDFNCDRSYVVYLGKAWGTQKQLNELASKEIKTLRVWTSDSYIQKEFTTDQSKVFMSAIACLRN